VGLVIYVLVPNDRPSIWSLGQYNLKIPQYALYILSSVRRLFHHPLNEAPRRLGAEQAPSIGVWPCKWERIRRSKQLGVDDLWRRNHRTSQCKLRDGRRDAVPLLDPEEARPGTVLPLPSCGRQGRSSFLFSCIHPYDKGNTTPHFTFTHNSLIS
jgi:hypothetical protein